MDKTMNCNPGTTENGQKNGLQSRDHKKMDTDLGIIENGLEQGLSRDDKERVMDYNLGII